MSDAEADLTWAPAWRIRERIVAKELSPIEVLEHFAGRIEIHDPVLRAFRHLDLDAAMREARMAENAVARGDEVGPLHGVPVSVKEHLHVAGMPTMDLGGGGERIAAHDHIAIERLREAGAIVIGTNTMMGTSAAGSALAVVTKQAGTGFNWDREARNAWDPTRVPGWSSSGGAASTSAGLIPLAIGSDGGGSTRLPAAFSGVVGVHPTVGLIPTVDLESASLPTFNATVGPLCRNVRDAAIALQTMAGPDGRDFTCIKTEPADLLGEIDGGVAGMNLAWTDDYGFADIYSVPESGDVFATVESAATRLESLGAHVVSTDESWEDFWEGYLTTKWVSHGVAGRGRGTQFPEPEPEQWVKAIETRNRNWQRFRRLFSTHDALLSPTSQMIAPTVDQWDANWAGRGAKCVHGSFSPMYTSHTNMFNWLGFPALSVPCGFVQGLPVGLQIVGWPGTEAKLFRIANAFVDSFPLGEMPELTS